MNDSVASAPPAGSVEPRSETETRWYGYRLVFLQLLCVILTVMSVGLFALSIPAHGAALHVVCTSASAQCHTPGQITSVGVNPAQGSGLSIDFIAVYLSVIASVLSLDCWLVAAILFWRKPHNPLALLAVLYLGTWPIVLNTAFTSSLPSSWWLLVARVISLISTVCFF